MGTSIKIALGGLIALAGCGETVPPESRPGGDAVTGKAAAVSFESGALARETDGPVRVRCPSVIPAALNPPADATLTAGYNARGVQIYACVTPAAGGAPTWTLKAPHAVLFQGPDAAVIHFAGPSWQALDGSLVTGTRVASDPGPDPTAIPWLLLSAVTNVGPGLLSDVTYIQRLATEGGLAPTTGCDADHLGAQSLVPYRADYFFYHRGIAGHRVRQCAAP